ncbi:transposase protein domain-containing protein [Phthorimaea operculella]|nr:transposase protein domain-containing protein [Phthorimaea operculella]
MDIAPEIKTNNTHKPYFPTALFYTVAFSPADKGHRSSKPNSSLVERRQAAWARKIPKPAPERALNFYSPAAYKYVRSKFHSALPHPRVLTKWYENTSISPGFTKQAFDILKKKNTLSGKRSLCVLVADEMAIRHQTLWTGKKTDGLVDYGIGNECNNEIATQVYVFILVGLDECWKLPVAYFFVKSLQAQTRANLMTTCLSKCHDSGVDVAAVTFDGCASNLGAASILGCDFSTPENLKTTFPHPLSGKDVAVFLDPCHMIKLVRNTFESKRIIFGPDDKPIRWQLIVNLNNLQKSEGLNFANKLTNRHIAFRNEVMKVKLATQLLSRSIALALKLCDQLSIASNITNTAPTVQFVTIFNNLFDILNTKASGDYGYKKPLSTNNQTEIMDFLEQAKNYILSLKIYNKTRWISKKRIILNLSKKRLVECKSKTGFLGFLICIESLKFLFSTYVVGPTPLLRYISTYGISQDHIEILFGHIRRHGGYNNNPNVIQFKGIYKKLFNHLELRSSFSGNCIQFEHFPILTCSSSGVTNINESTSSRGQYADDDSHPDNNTPEKDETPENNIHILADILRKENCSESAKQITGYISGWIARKLVRVIKCETCIDALFSKEKLWFHKLIAVRDMGGLCFSSVDLFTVCLKSESVIKCYIKENGISFPTNHHIEALRSRILKHFLNSNVFDSLNDHSMDQSPLFNHRLNFIRAIIEKYTNVRLHFAHKNNTELKKTSKRQKRNKLSLFEGV